MTANANAPEPPSASARLVQVGAAVLLTGGFYYGVVQQKRVLDGEAVMPVVYQTKQGKREVMRVRATTFLERRLGLDRPLPPGSAAARALLGGAIVAVTGSAVAVLGLGAALGVSNVAEFRARMEQLLPQICKTVLRVELDLELLHLSFHSLVQTIELGMNSSLGSSILLLKLTENISQALNV
ncbi:hypothetical protein P43SY_007804 [Pythium insidiosum]|uniref:Uncharacterized protein n=1 Tax=Pythium insidiosum TaxID=114742 RepID=A0AAD5Q9E4_PYTIN|nr:hypothetical protein P43SY_007804 [Pythium insidiosum]